jgi:G patch domain-containing protein 1
MGDGSFVVIGTAKEIPETVEEEIARRKKNDYENQVVKDKQGRRRFHGAFTGGFSAGFFNTVGSKEGTRYTQYKLPFVTGCRNLKIGL